MHIHQEITVLSIYDTIISSPYELLHIWKRKYSTTTLLYLFIRYGTILNIFFLAFYVFYPFTSVLVSGFGLLSLWFSLYVDGLHGFRFPVSLRPASYLHHPGIKHPF